MKTLVCFTVERDRIPDDDDDVDTIIVEFRFASLNLGTIRAMKFEAVGNSSLVGMNNGLTQVTTKSWNNR